MREKKGRRAGMPVPGAVVAMGGAASVLMAILMLAVTSIFASAGAIPERMLEICVPVNCALGCLLGGLLSLTWGRKGGLVVGVLSGGAAAILLGVTGVLLYSNLDMERCAAVTAACFVGGAVAGILRQKGSGSRRKW